MIDSTNDDKIKEKIELTKEEEEGLNQIGKMMAKKMSEYTSMMQGSIPNMGPTIGPMHAQFIPNTMGLERTIDVGFGHFRVYLPMDPHEAKEVWSMLKKMVDLYLHVDK